MRSRDHCLSWAQQSGEQPNSPIELPGKPIPPDYSKLSEYNIEWLKTQSAQVQMEFLLGAAINHDHGATDMIAKLVEGWHGKLHRAERWQDLETTALYSNDLRVRAAAIEINLAVNNLATSGMLTREQRMKAVPGLLELTDDPSLNATTRLWVYQALREITDENLPNDPATWRNWYSSKGAERTREFKQADSWAVLGNN